MYFALFVCLLFSSFLQYLEQKDNSVIVKEFYLPDGNFKKNIAAYCKHHAVFGSILRVVVSDLSMFKLVNPGYSAPPTDIRHRLRVEGTQSNIDAMFRDVFTNVNNLKESDLIEIDAKHFDTLPTHGGFIIEQTDTGIRRDDSSGKKTKRSEFTARSQSSGESQQWAFKEKMYVRDDGKCRLHGDNYQCIHLGRMEEAKACHISGVNADRVASVDEKRLTFDAFNGYLFCHKAERAWSIYLFTVDVITGYAIFAPEFPYKLMNIKKGAQIKIGFWDRNDFKGYKFDTKKAAKTTGASEDKNENANESKDTESNDHESKEESNESDIDMRMIVEQPRYLLEKRHEFYIASRKQKYEEDKDLKHFCDYCGKGFDEESKKLDHTRDAHKDGKEVEDIQQWHFYVTKLPLCSCTNCAQMNA